MSESNRNSSVDNHRVAAMRLNVPDCSTANGAVTETTTHHSVPSMPINHIDSNVVNVNNNLIVTANGVDPSSVTTVLPTTTTIVSSTATVTTTMAAPATNVQTSSHIYENGTLMGTIIAQPSLTIHVNQSEKRSHTNLNIQHHPQQQTTQVSSTSLWPLVENDEQMRNDCGTLILSVEHR